MKEFKGGATGTVEAVETVECELSNSETFGKYKIYVRFELVESLIVLELDLELLKRWNLA